MKLDELVIEATTLGSGLRALAIPLAGLHHAVISACLRSGPTYERPEHNGVCHFLEHMLYRGTPRHPSAHAQADAFESLGGTLAATTFVDHGTVAIGVPLESLGRVLPLFAEVYREPKLEGIEVEKGIVREEILEGLDDDGNDIEADELIRELCFGEHALGRPIVGTIEKLDGFRRPLLARYHRELYVGENSVVAVAGPIDPRRVLRDLERELGGLKAGRSPKATRLPAQRGPKFRYVKNVASQTDLRVAFRAPGDLDPLEPATDLVLRVLDDGMSTRLYHRICDQKGLCYDVSAGYEAYVAGGIFDLAAETAHERAPAVLDELLALIRELRDHGPTDVELAKVKQRLAWSFEQMLDDAGEVAGFVASGVLTGVAASPRERRDQLLSVSLAEVRRAGERMFAADGLSVLAVGNLGKRVVRAMESATRAFE